MCKIKKLQSIWAICHDYICMFAHLFFCMLGYIIGQPLIFFPQTHSVSYDPVFLLSEFQSVSCLTCRMPFNHLTPTHTRDLYFLFNGSLWHCRFDCLWFSISEHLLLLTFGGNPKMLSSVIHLFHTCWYFPKPSI